MINNAKILSELFIDEGLRVVSGGTDNHLMLIDTRSIGTTGDIAEKKLNSVGIVVNKNAIPYDPLPPKITSGIRIGTPAITTRKISTNDLLQIGNLIVDTLKKPDKDLSVISEEVKKIMNKLPLP